MKRGRKLSVSECKAIARMKPELDVSSYVMEKITNPKGGGTSYLLRHKNSGEHVRIDLPNPRRRQQAQDSVTSTDADVDITQE